MLRDAESTIKQRSEAAEKRWPLDKLIKNFEAHSISKVCYCLIVQFALRTKFEL